MPRAFLLRISGEEFNSPERFVQGTKHLRSMKTLVPMPSFILEAADGALEDILGDLMNIPRPNNHTRSFTWFGDTAKTILVYLINKYESQS
jgi:fructose-1,6-bisphosphatase